MLSKHVLAFLERELGVESHRSLPNSNSMSVSFQLSRPSVVRPWAFTTALYLRPSRTVSCAMTMSWPTVWLCSSSAAPTDAWVQRLRKQTVSLAAKLKPFGAYQRLRKRKQTIYLSCKAKTIWGLLQ